MLKLLTNELFYFGGIIGGWILYLTGLPIEKLSSILIIVILDIFTRCWAEKKNKRPILSNRMFYGFSGKLMSYMILFIAANNTFYINEILSYIVLTGFGLVEFRSVYENLKDAGQHKHIAILEDRIEGEIKEFTERRGKK